AVRGGVVGRVRVRVVRNHHTMLGRRRPGCSGGGHGTDAGCWHAYAYRQYTYADGQHGGAAGKHAGGVHQVQSASFPVNAPRIRAAASVAGILPSRTSRSTPETTARTSS